VYDYADAAPAPQARPVVGGALPSVRPTGAAGRYSDLSQVAIGNDLKNQIFSQFGLGNDAWSQKAEGESGQYNLGTLTPEAEAKLRGYTFGWSPTGNRNEGLLTLVNPQGQQAGRFYQTPGQSTGEALREYAGMLTSAANFMFPGITAGLIGKLGLGAAGSGAVGGALSSLIQGTNPLRGALMGGLSPLSAPYLQQLGSAASEAVGGGALGRAVGAGLTGAARSGLGAAVQGGDIGRAMREGIMPAALRTLPAPLLDVMRLANMRQDPIGAIRAGRNLMGATPRSGGLRAAYDARRATIPQPPADRFGGP
jgi:hypothetical protein